MKVKHCSHEGRTKTSQPEQVRCQPEAWHKSLATKTVCGEDMNQGLVLRRYYATVAANDDTNGDVSSKAELQMA